MNLTGKQQQKVTAKERDGQVRCVLCALPLGKHELRAVCDTCRRNRKHDTQRSTEVEQ